MISWLNKAREDILGDFIGGYTEGSVFSLGKRFVIKIASHPITLKGKDPEERFVHTALFRKYVLPELPEWADIVGNIIRFNERGTLYTIMPRVGNCVSLLHLDNYLSSYYKHRNPGGINEAIARDYPDLDRGILGIIKDPYEYLKTLVSYSAARTMPGRTGLIDTNFGIFIVEPLQQSVGGYYYRLSIIDQ